MTAVSRRRCERYCPLSIADLWIIRVLNRDNGPPLILRIENPEENDPWLRIYLGAKEGDCCFLQPDKLEGFQNQFFRSKIHELPLSYPIHTY